MEAGSARVHGGALFELLRGPNFGAVPRDRATPGSGFGVQATLARRTWEEVGSRGRDSGGWITPFCWLPWQGLGSPWGKPSQFG